MKKVSLKKHEGFSLIELVIVVAIIGILALMILPQFNTVTEDAKKKTWQANCQNVVAAIGMYQAANEGRYPTSTADFNKYIQNGFPTSDAANASPKAEYSYNEGTHVFTGTWTGSDNSTVQFIYPNENSNNSNNSNNSQ